MRIESTVTSVSWIPSEAVTGLGKMAFEMGVTHYDAPPPDAIAPESGSVRAVDLEELRADDRFRFANVLSAWVEVEDGRVTDHGYSGCGMIGTTTVRLGPAKVTFQNVLFPDIQHEPEITPTGVRFVQTAGGRTGVPAPRRVRRKPFVQLSAPTVWTTLALTIGADGSTSHEVVGASSFPRHWVYDAGGALVAKSGITEFKDWYVTAFGAHSPWGDEDSPALITAAETALERSLSASIMRQGAKPSIRKLKKDDTLVEQGDEGGELFLLLDGVLAVEVDGEAVADVGPGALLGERALLEGGRRTSTLRAVTPCRVAVTRGDQLDPAALAEVSTGHRREDD